MRNGPAGALGHRGMRRGGTRRPTSAVLFAANEIGVFFASEKTLFTRHTRRLQTGFTAFGRLWLSGGLVWSAIPASAS